jgi:putative Ca2+/H+ antiporter (TMEM165/GDT1 family)
VTKLLPVTIDFAPEPTQTDSQETPEKIINCVNVNTNTVIDTEQPVNNSDRRQKSMVVFGTTFLTIFLAEIGDKTQLSTLLMSAESHEPWMVFIGSAIALITTSLLGVLVGSVVASKLSPKTIEVAAGVMLLVISLMLIGDVLIG